MMAEAHPLEDTVTKTMTPMTTTTTTTTTTETETANITATEDPTRSSSSSPSFMDTNNAVDANALLVSKEPTDLEIQGHTNAAINTAVVASLPGSIDSRLLHDHDRSAFAKEPTYTEEDLQKIENARAFCQDLQRVYADYLQKAQELKYQESRPADSGGQDGAGTSSVHVLQLHNLSLLSRIYIGSIHFELSELDLRQAFAAFGPVKSLSLQNDPITGHHKGYCFMEFDTPEAAALAVETLNGGELGGRSIKIGRPNNFPLELPQGLPPALPSRLYFSNVFHGVTEPDLREIFASFGPVAALSLVPDMLTKRGHKGYGFVQFQDAKTANTALMALKGGYQLGGLELKVGRTIIGGDFPPGMSILDKIPAGKSGLALGRQLPESVASAAKSIIQDLNLKESKAPNVPSVASPPSSIEAVKVPSRAASSIAVPTPKAVSISPTNTNNTNAADIINEPAPVPSNASSCPFSVMILSNMITPDQVEPDLRDEVVEECSLFGPIDSSYFVLSNAAVFVYIVFKLPDAASLATPKFSGRWFDGRKVVATEIPFHLFEALKPSFHILL